MMQHGNVTRRVPWTAAPKAPVPVPEGNSSGYHEEPRKFPLPEVDQKNMLAKSWREFGSRGGRAALQ
jgi:hypothetical protein